jgi:hypothetical protein
MTLKIAAAAALLLAGAAAGAEPPADPVVADVLARDIALQTAYGRGDYETYRAGLSKNYVYIDVGGQRVTIDRLLKRRAADGRRVISSKTSEEEAIRLSDTVVLLRGLDRGLAHYYGGLPRKGETRWTSLWVREADGVWRLTADTATPVRDSEASAMEPAPQSAETLARHAGRWTLATDTPLTMTLRAHDGRLLGSLDGQTVTFSFHPLSATRFVEAERPFELSFSDDGDRLTLVTWGTATAGRRVPDGTR